MRRRWQALVPMSTPDLKLPPFLSHSQEFGLMMMIIVIVFMVFDEEASRTLKIIVNITFLRMTTYATLTCDVSANRAILPRNFSAGNLALS